LSESQKRAYIIADNKLALNSGWDEELLAAELADLEQAGMDLALVGFSDDELRGLLYADTDSAAAETGVQIARFASRALWRTRCQLNTMLSEGVSAICFGQRFRRRAKQ
jgi:ParB-like chromosome segregation protein Spo0J